MLNTSIWRAAAWGEKDPCPLYGQGVFLLGVVALSTGNSHSFLSQYVADAALGNRDLKLDLEEIGQFLLGEGWILSFLLPQPSPTLRGCLVRVTMAVVNQGLPGRACLAVATPELGKVVPAERKAQFPTEGLKVFPLVKALEELFLGQSSLDLMGGVAFHRIPPGLR